MSDQDYLNKTVMNEQIEPNATTDSELFRFPAPPTSTQTPLSLEERKELIIKNCPEDGSTIGNQRIRKITGLEKEEYFEAQRKLIEEGQIIRSKGNGGAIRLVAGTEAELSGQQARDIGSESDLYIPFIQFLEDEWVPNKDIHSFVIQDTSSQGRRNTGGKWTRPDISLVAVRNYEFIPSKILNLITFELKKNIEDAVTGVFETVAHTRFANFAYLCVHTQEMEKAKDSPAYEQVEADCEKFGIGLILFTDPNDSDTYITEVEAAAHSPDPHKLDEFIRTQVNEDKKRVLKRYI